MKKVITAAQTREADQFTIKNEPIPSIDLMERAAAAFVAEFEKWADPDKSISIVCGPGNNGGDGFAIGRKLQAKGYTVQCALLKLGASLSPDCQVNYNRWTEHNSVVEITGDAVPEFGKGLIIDAMFGSGLNRPLEGLPALVVERINQSGLPVVAVDIPSGLFADAVVPDGAIVAADLTITFQLPKLSFLIPESGKYAGEWRAVDIGLSQVFLEAQESNHYLIDSAHVSQVLPNRPKFGHKGTFGRVQLVAGSKGKMGAATLCGAACLRSGAGLLTIHVPEVGLNVVQTVLKEAMATVDDRSDHISDVPAMEQINVIGLGPGLGTHKETVGALTRLLHETEKPMVIDADGLNAIAMTPGLLKHVPKGSVLTPHVGEFERLFGTHAHGMDRISKMQEVAVTNQLVLVLKGAHTAIVNEAGQVFFNTTGNAGMATAGSGDVLTGMITGLMAQGLSGEQAAIAGVYLHGLAGDLAANKVGKLSLMASNLLSEIPKALNNVTITSIF